MANIYRIIFAFLTAASLHAKEINNSKKLNPIDPYGFYKSGIDLIGYQNRPDALFNENIPKAETPARRGEIMFFISLAFTITYSYALGKFLPYATFHKKINTGPGFDPKYYFIAVNSVLWASCIAVNDYYTIKNNEKILKLIFYNKKFSL